MTSRGAARCQGVALRRAVDGPRDAASPPSDEACRVHNRQLQPHAGPGPVKPHLNLLARPARMRWRTACSNPSAVFVIDLDGADPYRRCMTIGYERVGNGGRGVIMSQDGFPQLTMNFAGDKEGRISDIFIMRNPDKLAHLDPVAIH